MSAQTILEKKEFIKGIISATQKDKIHNFRLYNFFWIAVRIIKVVVALLTSIGAILTGLTKLSWAPWMTAIAGVMTALIEVVVKETRSDIMRSHYYNYQIKFKQLIDRIEIEPNLDEQLLMNYLNEYQEVEREEVENRPTFGAKLKI